jgi:hypothetical protein
MKLDAIGSSLPPVHTSIHNFATVRRRLALVTVLVLGWSCYGQQIVSAENQTASIVERLDIALPELPEAPLPQSSQDSGQTKPLVAASPKTVPATTGKPVVGRYVKYIPADSAAPQIHGREKFILGARDLYSAGNFAAMFVSAGWEQMTNSEPNYGTDRGAFGARLGAAGIRETTEGIFTDGVFSVMLHEDPRYFVLGPQYGMVHRTLYAITRPLVTRNSSDGHRTINGGLLLGYAASAALTDAYYPQSNRNFHDTFSTYAGSIGGAALGFAIDEFYDQALEAVHLKKKP